MIQPIDAGRVLRFCASCHAFMLTTTLNRCVRCHGETAAWQDPIGPVARP